MLLIDLTMKWSKSKINNNKYSDHIIHEYYKISITECYQQKIIHIN